MEFTGHAVYGICGCHYYGADRRGKYYQRFYADRRADKCNCLCASDPYVADDGNIRVYNDHDRGSIYRPYHRSTG